MSGMFFSQSCSSRPEQRTRGSKPSSTNACQPVARHMKHHALVLVSPTLLVLETGIWSSPLGGRRLQKQTEHILAGKKQFLNIPDWWRGTQIALILFCALGVHCWASWLRTGKSTLTLTEQDQGISWASRFKILSFLLPTSEAKKKMQQVPSTWSWSAHFST